MFNSSAKSSFLSNLPGSFNILNSCFAAFMNWVLLKPVKASASSPFFIPTADL